MVKDFDDMKMEENPMFEICGNNDGVEVTPD